MKNTRAIAAEILAEVFTAGASLNSVLPERLKNSLKANDRGLIQELCYGVLRWYWQLDAITKVLVKKPLKTKDNDIQALLLIGFYQLIYLRVPTHAAIHETVQATRDLKKAWASGLVNATLREFERQKDKLLQKVAHNAVIHLSHPVWLLDALQKAWPDAWEKIVTANNQPPPLTLRVNQLQQTRDGYLQLLIENNISASAAEYAQAGIRLEHSCDVSQLPGFAEGKLSVQDAAAQLAAGLLALAPGLRVLDACAAPGGKTTHILEMQPDVEKLVAIDIEAERLEKIAENLLRLQLYDKSKVTLVCADAAVPAAWWDGQLFDRILLDAPCSATGVIRRHPDIKLLRRSEDIPQLADLQLQLLNTLWPLLKPNGLLLYITCSVLPQENTEVLKQFLADHPEAKEQVIDAPWGIATEVGRQIFPQQHGMDGFYYVQLIKTSLDKL